jgi:hypothetical protein
MESISRPAPAARQVGILKHGCTRRGQGRPRSRTEREMNRHMVARRMALVAPLLALMGGCVGLETNSLCSCPPPTEAPCRVVAFWESDVYYPPDPVHGGAESPTLAGRVYLFGPEIKYPMPGDGTLTVAAYDCAVTPGPDVKPLNAWTFDANTLHRLLKKDVFGWGYTIPLPWPGLPANLTHVQIKVCYEPAKGTPLYSESSVVALNVPGATPVVTTSAKPRER